MDGPGSAGPSDAGTTSNDNATAVNDAGASGAGVAAAPIDAGAAPASTQNAAAAAAAADEDACGFAGAAFEKRARPQVKACYREGKKKDANLVGGVRIVVNITDKGKVGNIMSSPNGDRTMLPKDVVKCMVDAVKKTEPGDVDKCKGKSVVIPIAFPTE
jgi:hypothetical protein